MQTKIVVNAFVHTHRSLVRDGDATGSAQRVPLAKIACSTTHILRLTQTFTQRLA
ncbi:MAG: hypothetical protein H6855_07390 [Rhodospirillales bacterium]|nr:hypothetical protein [Rhodospirillales bacterium]